MTPKGQTRDSNTLRAQYLGNKVLEMLFANYYIVCCEAALSAILMTAMASCSLPLLYVLLMIIQSHKRHKVAELMLCSQVHAYTTIPSASAVVQRDALHCTALAQNAVFPNRVSSVRLSVVTTDVWL